MKTKKQKRIKDLKLKEVRTYCESECNCPTCHLGLGNKGVTDVEKCFYCQKKWKNKGEYANPKKTRGILFYLMKPKK